MAHWGADQDVFGLYREGGAIEVQVLFVRHGTLVGTMAYGVDDLELPDGDVLEEVLTQFYQATARDVPDEILLPAEIGDAAVRTEYLSERHGSKVQILVPQRGDKVRLLELARENARQSFAHRRERAAEGARQIAELQRKLHLRAEPRRIECVDIATLHGGESVGAVIALVDGQPWKDGYRRFRIRSVVGTDDFASVAEVLRRRFRVGERRDPLPDLLVIDGGLGQLTAARDVLGEVGLADLPVIGLAKERVTPDATAREVARRPERVFLPGRRNPVVLRTNSTALFVLQRARDEAHRFANAYHRRLRDRARLRSPLDDVAGVGPRRRRQLLRHFGSLARLRAATPAELAAVPGISEALANRILEALAT
jgi:excinuclease ABC subunit C